MGGRQSLPEGPSSELNSPTSRPLPSILPAPTGLTWSCPHGSDSLRASSPLQSPLLAHPRPGSLRHFLCKPAAFFLWLLKRLSWLLPQDASLHPLPGLNCEDLTNTLTRPWLLSSRSRVPKPSPPRGPQCGTPPSPLPPSPHSATPATLPFLQRAGGKQLSSYLSPKHLLTH